LTVTARSALTHPCDRTTFVCAPPFMRTVCGWYEATTEKLQ